jgi:hypothetical protein
VLARSPRRLGLARMAGAVDWALVGELLGSLAALSPQVARVELGGVADKIVGEKKKLKGLCAKHAQACDELVKVRKAVQKEREKLLELHSAKERELAALNARPGREPGEVNQLSLELAAARKKVEGKRAEHAQYVAQHLDQVHKRERMVAVQARTVRNLLHRRIALAERASSGASPDDAPQLPQQHPQQQYPQQQHPQQQHPQQQHPQQQHPQQQHPRDESGDVARQVRRSRSQEHVKHEPHRGSSRPRKAPAAR